MRYRTICPRRRTTSFTAISRRVYSDEKYGLALKQFNEQSSEKAVPLPGHKVLIPPIAFLEQNFASAIGRVPPLGSNQPIQSNSSTGSFPPRISDKPFTPEYVPPLANNPTTMPRETFDNRSPSPAPIGDSRPPRAGNSDGIKIYRVTAPGENIIDIARRTLGQSRAGRKSTGLTATWTPRTRFRVARNCACLRVAVVPRP